MPKYATDGSHADSVEEENLHDIQSKTFRPSEHDYENPVENPADLDRFYGPFREYVRMVTGGYSNMLMLDAKGGLGKSHNVKDVLSEECESDEWTHLKGFTTPIELYKSLYMARRDGHVIFLDDMSGVTGNTKAVDMLKSATDTEGSENYVEYRTSRDIEHPKKPGRTLPNTFTFRGRVILSFNETPDNRHFNALKDRGTYYNLEFSYDERIELIQEIAKIPSFSGLSVREQQETAKWIEQVTDVSMEVSIRTFEEVCEMRRFGKDRDADWERMALEVFDIDHEKYLIIRMRKNSDMPVEDQVKYFEEKTGHGSSYYYDLWDEIRDEMD
jgi:hypothetical protein